MSDTYKYNDTRKVPVLAPDGEPLMPCSPARARILVKKGAAICASHNPYTIQLTREPAKRETSPMELKVDTGTVHIGISICTEREELVSEQRDLFTDEKKKHDARRSYRRDRRGRLRYRKSRFDNRKRGKGWLAPSVQHRVDAHLQRIQRLLNTYPVTHLIVEIGQFDPVALKAFELGEDAPQGKDYQKGARAGLESLRAAVFVRDNHRCQVCDRGVEDGAILHAHHVYYWKPDHRHGSQVDELLTVCEKCHTPANHKKGGALWGLEQKRFVKLSDAASMNVIGARLREALSKLSSDSLRVSFTYGSATKVARRDLGLEKSHVNDAFSMGEFHPLRRVSPKYYRKRRRNNRVLEKFYDAVFIDSRTGSNAKGSELGCERTKRCIPRNNSGSLRCYRERKVKKGYRSIRSCRYSIQSGDVLRRLDSGEVIVSLGVHCRGASVQYLPAGESKRRNVSVRKVEVVRHVGGWVEYAPDE